MTAGFHAISEPDSRVSCLPRRIGEPCFLPMAKTTKRTGTRSLPLDGMTPIEVAAGLRHLPGLVFFDTAGNLPSSAGQPVSVIAARPTRILRG